VEGFKKLKNELQNILSGTIKQSESSSIQAAKAYLSNDTKSGSKSKSAKPTRPEEERALIEYAIAKDILINKELLGIYITEGAEQQVFYKENKTTVFKIADAIFYSSWFDYFNSLLLHNYFFSSAK
jgi:hypothetical protein